MATWYSLALGDALTAQVALAEIRDALAAVQPACESSGRAVFTRQVSGELHCEITAYFSPAAAELARRFGAAPCASPVGRGLEWLAGDTSFLADSRD